MSPTVEPPIPGGSRLGSSKYLGNSTDLAFHAWHSSPQPKKRGQETWLAGEAVAAGVCMMHFFPACPAEFSLSLTVEEITFA